MSEHGCTPTSPSELARQIMDSNVPKNEREWWARDEIERLRGRKEQDDQLLWRETLDRACLAERKAIEDRLREPDDEIAKIMINDILPGPGDPPMWIGKLRALADALFPSSETPEAPSKEAGQ